MADRLGERICQNIVRIDARPPRLRQEPPSWRKTFFWRVVAHIIAAEREVSRRLIDDIRNKET